MAYNLGMKSILVLCPFIALTLTGVAGLPQLVGKFHYPFAAFSSLTNNSDGSGYDLLLSSFGMFSSDVSVVADVGKYMNDVTQISPLSISKSLKWPNEVSGVPFQALQGHYVVIPDGFLVPTKTDGSLTLYNLDQAGSPLDTISSPGQDWFYHRVLWVDMDKDGQLDALTCRANKPVFGSAKGQLVWFANPPSHSVTNPWQEFVVAGGPDIFFTLAHFEVGTKTYEVIVVAEFFSQRMTIYWSEDYRQDWSNKTYVKNRVIDSSVGSPFDVLVTDVNGDGRLDIVATTNSDHNGTVLVYEVPADFRTGQYTRHLIADGYAAKSKGINKGGPGSPYVITPSNRVDAARKPAIFISGDDAAVLSLLTAQAPLDPNNWDYTRTDFLTTGSSTVGGLSFADVDGDGKVELFAPSYDEGFVYVYRL